MLRRRLVRRAFSSPTRLYGATRLCDLRKAAKPYRCLRSSRTCSCIKDQGWILPKWTRMVQVHTLFCVNTTQVTDQNRRFYILTSFLVIHSLCVENNFFCVYLQCHIFFFLFI